MSQWKYALLVTNTQPLSNSSTHQDSFVQIFIQQLESLGKVKTKTPPTHSSG